MVMLRTLVGIAALAFLMELAVAANYTVGAPNGGWDLMTPLQAWANSQNFSVGDSLTFAYAANHNVVEVSKPDYDACLTNNSLASYSGGMTVVTLSSSGNRYFICGTQGHCDTGMKMVITTFGASAPAPAPAGTPPAPAPATPSAPSPATPSGSPTAASPVGAPVSSPPTTAPVQAPKKAPTASPSKSPASSPASAPSISTGESPAIPPLPGADSPSTIPNSASKINVFAGFIVGFGSLIIMVLTL